MYVHCTMCFEQPIDRPLICLRKTVRVPCGSQRLLALIENQPHVGRGRSVFFCVVVNESTIEWIQATREYTKSSLKLGRELERGTFFSFPHCDKVEILSLFSLVSLAREAIQLVFFFFFVPPLCSCSCVWWWVAAGVCFQQFSHAITFRWKKTRED